MSAPHNDTYLGIDRKERGTSIFRFTTWDHVLELIALQRNTLVSPRQWDDPFENILNRMKFRKANGQVFCHPLRDRVYGQCWTLTEETDAAWRMYVPHGNGVRLKTTIGKLHRSLEHSQNNSGHGYASISCFIGRVQYKTQDELEGWFLDPTWVKEHLWGVGSQGQAESLLFKREAFEPEHEIRLIYLDPHNSGTEDFFSYAIDPSNLIEQITFDPRMKDGLYEKNVSSLRSLSYGGTIDKSDLYQIPNIEHPI